MHWIGWGNSVTYRSVLHGHSEFILAENVTNELILEHLKSIQAKLGTMAADLTDLKADMRGLKAHMAGFMQSEVAQDSAIAGLQLRLDRIEKRLELADSE